MTLSAGAAAVHQSILGDRMRLPFDQTLSHAVTGAAAALTHPALVLRRRDRSIHAGHPAGQGQPVLPRPAVSPLPDHRRHALHPNRSRWPETELGQAGANADGPCGLADDDHRPGRPTGARLPSLRHAAAARGRLRHGFRRRPVGHRHRRHRRRGDPTEAWDADAFRSRVAGPHFDPAIVGAVLHGTADVVSSAPELARLTLNIAATHHDSRVGGRRLVYGGHTIGLARSWPRSHGCCRTSSPCSAGRPATTPVLCTRATPSTARSTWKRRHRSRVAAARCLSLRSLVYAVDEPDRQVLDWRFTALMF